MPVEVVRLVRESWTRTGARTGNALLELWSALTARGREVFVLLCVCVGALGAGLYILSTPKTYRASAQIFVTTRQTTVGELGAGQTFIQSQMQSYVSVVTSPLVLGPVAKSLHGLDGTSVTADAPLDQVLLNVHAEASSATRAATVANAVARQTIVAIGDLQSSAIELTIIHTASPPTSPVAPQKKLALIIGLVGGLLLGLVVVLGRERIAARIRSARDLEDVSTVPVLGVIPNERAATTTSGSSDALTLSARGEAFRRLRTNLQFVNVDQPPKVLAVTSAEARDGKTSVAVNLAVHLADVGLKVCLVEANLRQPALAQMLPVDGGRGLTTLLVGTRKRSEARPAPGTGLDEVVQEVRENLNVITSGPLPPNPADLLASRQLRAAIAELRERYDYVLLDTASLLPIADGAEVIAAVDAALLVVRARRTTRRQFMASLEAIERVDGSVAGLVLYRAQLPSATGRHLRPSSDALARIRVEP